MLRIDAQAAADSPGWWRRTHVLPQTGPGDTTVSPEDEQNVRHWVFCDRLLPGG